MNKHHKLIVGTGQRGFSLANETDADPYSDYSPGAWAISRKLAVKWAKEYIERGDTVTVSTYNKAHHAKVGNEIIAELGIKQEKFKEPVALPPSKVTSGKPSTFAEFKRYFTVGTKLRVCYPGRKSSDGVPLPSRETFINSVQSNAVTTDKNGNKSWLYWEKASQWTLDNEGATYHYIDSDSGAYVPSIRIEYV